MNMIFFKNCLPQKSAGTSAGPSRTAQPVKNQSWRPLQFCCPQESQQVETTTRNLLQIQGCRSFSTEFDSDESIGSEAMGIYNLPFNDTIRQAQTTEIMTDSLKGFLDTGHITLGGQHWQSVRSGISRYGDYHQVTEVQNDAGDRAVLRYLRYKNRTRFSADQARSLFQHSTREYVALKQLGFKVAELLAPVQEIRDKQVWIIPVHSDTNTARIPAHKSVGFQAFHQLLTVWNHQMKHNQPIHFPDFRPGNITLSGVFIDFKEEPALFPVEELYSQISLWHFSPAQRQSLSELMQQLVHRYPHHPDGNRVATLSRLIESGN